MKRRFTTIAFVSLLFSLSTACGGSGRDDAPASTPEAGVADSDLPDTHLPPPHDAPPRDTGPEVDNGAPSDTYPAYPVSMPELLNNGGYVMTSPTIVTVTWTGDP